MSARPIRQRFVDVQGTIDALPTSNGGVSTRVDQEIAALRDEQQLDVIEKGRLEGETTNLQGQARNLEAGRAALERAITDLKLQLSQLGWFEWSKKRQLEAAIATKEGALADQVAQIDALGRRIVAAEQDVAKQE